MRTINKRKMQSTRFWISLLLVTATSALLAQQPAFRDSRLPLEKRVEDLLNRLSLEEKISLMGYNARSVERLGIPAYNWWNEALHGVARAGEATVFPQAIAMAATFNDSLLHAVADAIATEARAKFNLAAARGKHIQYMGLTFWSPNINIFRDPRWGRGQETYGEDPFLTARMGSAFVRGLQGDDPRYLKAAAAAKHFAVHSGPEKGRHAFDAVVDEKDLRETYLYAFRQLVDVGVESIMCAYNRLNGQPCCASNNLLNDILRKEWNFPGHIVTDCGAIDDMVTFHKFYENKTEAVAATLKAGTSLDCSGDYQRYLPEALQKGLIKEEDIDRGLSLLLATQFKLGFYDAPESVPFSDLGAQQVNTPAHVALARQMAVQSMVLLKNEKNILPLNRQNYGSIMVLGPNAGAMDPLVANYHGMSGNMVSFAEGITKAAGPGIAVQYDQGSDFTDTMRFGGIWAAGESDITIAVIGLTPVYEGEEGDAFLAANGGDKMSLDLPAAHIALLRELRRKNKPVIAVVTAGSNVDLSAIEPYADAIILAWYPGEQGGHALADIVFGNTSPSGRLPITFYQNFQDLPDYADYSMKGRTYRYFKGEVQYPFGYGLSYTKFMYAWKQRPAEKMGKNDTISFSIVVQNKGDFDGDEVVQAYVEYPDGERMPLRELKAFKRVGLAKGTERIISLQIPVRDLQKWDLKERKWKLYEGEYRIVLGSHSLDRQLETTLRYTASKKK